MIHARSDYNKRIVDLENKIPENEPVFLLRGQDKLAPRLLLMWASELRLNGGDPNMAREAEDHAQRMLEWQKTHKVKTPDMYKESGEKKFIIDKLNEILYSEGKFDFKEFSNWMKQYFGESVSDHQLILMPLDVKEDSKFKSIDNLEYDDFVLSNEDHLKAYRVEIIIYYDGKNHKIFKDRLTK